MNRTHRWARRGRTGPLACLILTAAIAACTVEGVIDPDKKITGSPLPGVSSNPSPTPAGTGGKDGVGGNIGTGGTSPSPGATAAGTTKPSASPTAAGFTVKRVVITPAEATLNVPADDGITTATFPTSTSFGVKVELLPSGQNSQVTWSVSASSSVQLVTSATGVTVATEPTAPDGDVILRATSKQDPTQFATASIHITRESQLSFEIE